MRKRRDDHKHGDSDRWLLTYADMITLLMAFFIMMYSMSVLNLAKFRQAAISIRSGFGGLVKGQGKSVLGSSGMFGAQPSPIEGDTAGVSWKVLRPLVDFVENDPEMRKSIKLGEDRRGVVITLSSDSLLFSPGSAEIRPPARPVLDNVAVLLGKTPNLVQIEGHTCDLPPRGSKYPTNWELSTARATRVLRYLVEERGLPAKRFAAAGYGSARPAVGNVNAAAGADAIRQKSRRVEIILLRPELAEAVTPSGEERPIVNPDSALIQRRLD